VGQRFEPVVCPAPLREYVIPVRVAAAREESRIFLLNKSRTQFFVPTERELKTLLVRTYSKALV
jgi:hypothetical protein